MKIIKFLIPILFLIFGLFIFSYPMFFNANSMPGTLEDNRFINYVLEHGYNWIIQTKTHESFWNMPMFYPNKNTLAYSDILLGGMIIYTPIRFIIKNPQSAFQLFYIIVCSLNFITFFYLAKKIFKLDNLYSSFAAFFFSFCLPRSAQTQHIQLFIQFYMVLSIFFFASINEKYSKLKNKFLFLLGIIFFLVQIYTTFYFGWYMLFSLPIAIVSMLIFKNSREAFKNWFKNIDKNYIYLIIIGLIGLMPLCWHYLLVGSKFAKAEPSSWTHLFFSQSQFDLFFVDLTYFYFPEAILGIGFLTTILLISAIFKSKYKWTIILFAAIVIMTFCNDFIYSKFYDYFLPAAAIRALGRYVFILIPIWAIVLANYLKNTKSIVATLIMMFLIMLEQIPYVNHFDWNKTQHNTRIEKYTSNKDCEVISFEFKKDKEFYINNIDAIWYANNKNKYTTNGYSGFIPIIDNSFLDKKCIITSK